MDSLKITYIITGIAVILVGGFIYFSVYKNSDYFQNEGNNATTTNPNLEMATSTTYKNTKYGFSISLPKSWEGYTIVGEEWEGGPSISEDVTESGPLIFVRHPDWTDENQRQDIPVMVFTLTQWNKLTIEEGFHVGAAPIDPSELGRNKKYVFALPARYNFSYLTGFEEVDEIVRSDAFQAF